MEKYIEEEDIEESITEVKTVEEYEWKMENKTMRNVMRVSWRQEKRQQEKEGEENEEGDENVEKKEKELEETTHANKNKLPEEHFHVFFRVPIVKFWTNTLFYVWFLALQAYLISF